MHCSKKWCPHSLHHLIPYTKRECSSSLREIWQGTYFLQIWRGEPFKVSSSNGLGKKRLWRGIVWKNLPIIVASCPYSPHSFTVAGLVSVPESCFQVWAENWFFVRLHAVDFIWTMHVCSNPLFHVDFSSWRQKTIWPKFPFVTIMSFKRREYLYFLSWLKNTRENV